MKCHSHSDSFCAIEGNRRDSFIVEGVDLSATLQWDLDRVTIFYILIREAGLNDVSASVTVAHIQKVYNRIKISFGKHSLSE